MRVLSKRDVLGAVTDDSSEPGANGRRLRGRTLPLVVDKLRGIEPRLLLPFEAHIGPGLM